MRDGRLGYNARTPLPSGTRHAVLELLTMGHTPLTAAEIALRVQLHVTTIRFHLEQLEKAGLVRHTIERQGQRGRPRVLFTAATSARQDDANFQLVEVLASAVSADSDAGRARSIDAGKRWAEILMPEVAPMSDDVPGALVQTMEHLGFEPELVGGGPERSIQLLACPFRQTARKYPDVVCSVHRGLIEQILGTTGHASNEAILHPFVRPDLCAITLHGALGHPTASDSGAFGSKQSS